MDALKPFLGRSRVAKVLSKTNVYAGVFSMRLLRLVMPVVLVAKFAAWAVNELQDALGAPALRVAQDVVTMAKHTCKTCAEDRKSQGKSPRSLVAVPQETLQGGAFKRAGPPLHLCPFCDGDALPRAMDAHEKRNL